MSSELLPVGDDVGPHSPPSHKPMNQEAEAPPEEPATPDIAEAPELFRAFADQTRLRLLNLLRTGELCVCDLCTILEESQPKISRHLAFLRRVGLVSVRQQGKWKYYSIRPELDPLQSRLVHCVASCLGDFAPLDQDAQRLADLGPRNSSCLGEPE